MLLIPRPVGSAILLLAVAMVAVLATPVPSQAAGVTITIRDGFDPDTVTVTPGTTITWVNASGNRHRVRTTSGPAKIDSGNLEPGERFAATLSAVGTYAYLDAREPDDPAFWATIVVSEGSGGSGGGTGSGSSPGGAAALPTSASVGMADRAFGPSQVTIATGGTVTWRNDDDRAHTVTATGQSFDSGTMEAGANFEQSFPSAGSFAYLCVIHPEMTGTIVVQAVRAGTAAPATPPPAASPSQASPASTPPSGPVPIPPGPGDSAGSIQVVDFAFEPASLAIPAGVEVTVVNAGKAPHTITAVDGSFDSGTIPAGGTWSSTFTVPGSFAYLCAIHPEMTGVLEVTAAAAPAAGDPTASPDSAAAGGPTTPPGVQRPVSRPGDYLGLLAAVLLTGTATVLFMRTIGGIGRRPDHG